MTLEEALQKIIEVCESRQTNRVAEAIRIAKEALK